MKVENDRLNNELDQHKIFKVETQQRVEFQATALEMLKKHLKDINERLDSCNLFIYKPVEAL